MTAAAKWYSTLALAAIAGAMLPAEGHDGAPYPILVDRPAGSVLLSVWTDPDVGIGTFHIYLEPQKGKPLPPACVVHVAVQPVTGRLMEARHEAKLIRRDEARYHYLGEVPFDAAEDWRTRIIVRCGTEEAEADQVVAVTPSGQGPVLDFILYLLPFVGVGFLIVRALAARRRPHSSTTRAGNSRR